MLFRSIFSRYRKRELNFNDGVRLWFYRDNTGLEVDFVLEHVGKLNLVESKWTQYPDQKATKPMLRLSERLTNVKGQFLACRTDSSFPVGDSLAYHGLLEPIRAQWENNVDGAKSPRRTNGG